MLEKLKEHLNYHPAIVQAIEDQIYQFYKNNPKEYENTFYSTGDTLELNYPIYILAMNIKNFMKQHEEKDYKICSCDMNVILSKGCICGGG